MVCLHSATKELILLKNENVSFYPLQLSDTSALLLSTQPSLNIFAQKYLDKCEDTYFILHNKYLRIYKDSFGSKIFWDDCALFEMGKNYFTCSFLIFSIVSDKLRKKLLYIKSWHWFSACLSEREIWAFLKWTRTELPKMFLFCPFFMCMVQWRSIVVVEVVCRKMAAVFFKRIMNVERDWLSHLYRK